MLILDELSDFRSHRDVLSLGEVEGVSTGTGSSKLDLVVHIGHGYLSGYMARMDNRDSSLRPIEIPLGMGILDQMAGDLQQQVPDIRVEQNSETNTNILEINLNGKKASVEFYKRENGNIVPIVCLDLDTQLPLEQQIRDFIIIYEALGKAAMQVSPQLRVSFATNGISRIQDSIQRFIQSESAKVEQSEIEKYRRVLATTETIFSQMQPPYSEQLAKLEKARLHCLDEVPEPEFIGTSFPYPEMARYDFSFQPYMSETGSREHTQEIARVLDDLGITLTEPVVRLHYANSVTVMNQNGVSATEILTANPKVVFRHYPSVDWKRAEMSIGSTHQNVWDTKTHRESMGANYGLDTTDGNNIGRPSGADTRGIIYETLSEKLYGIWGLWQPFQLRRGTKDLETMELKKEESPAAPTPFDRNFEEKYGITILTGKSAFEAMESTIYHELTNQAAWLATVKTDQSTNTRWIRNRLLMRAGLPPE